MQGYFGTATVVPSGWVLETILTVSSGVNRAMENWGDKLLARYGKARYAYQRDYALTHLGYSTVGSHSVYGCVTTIALG